MAARQSASVWLLSREVNGDAGERYRQTVTVFAGSAAEAKAVVAAEFARIRRLTGKGEEAYQPAPPWRVEQVKLDGAKVITAAITQ